MSILLLLPLLAGCEPGSWRSAYNSSPTSVAAPIIFCLEGRGIRNVATGETWVRGMHNSLQNSTSNVLWECTPQGHRVHSQTGETWLKMPDGGYQHAKTQERWIQNATGGFVNRETGALWVRTRVGGFRNVDTGEEWQPIP